MQLSKSLKRIVRNACESGLRTVFAPITRSQAALQQIAQIQLMMRYRELASAGGPMPSYKDVGFGLFCDADEDGLLLFLISAVGSGHKQLIDLGSASVESSNCSNLILHAFFVRNDLAVDLIPEIQVEDGFPHPWNAYGMQERWPLVAEMPWEKV